MLLSGWGCRAHTLPNVARLLEDQDVGRRAMVGDQGELKAAIHVRQKLLPTNWLNGLVHCAPYFERDRDALKGVPVRNPNRSCDAEDVVHGAANEVRAAYARRATQHDRAGAPRAEPATPVITPHLRHPALFA